MNKVTVEDLEALQKMRDYLLEGQAVLVAGSISPDIPTIHDVGQREGHALQTQEEVKHAGFGFFFAGDWMFDGGGAMNHSKGFSWTLLLSRIGDDPATIGYDMPRVLSAVEALITELEG